MKEEEEEGGEKVDGDVTSSQLLGPYRLRSVG